MPCLRFRGCRGSPVSLKFRQDFHCDKYVASAAGVAVYLFPKLRFGSTVNEKCQDLGHRSLYTGLCRTADDHVCRSGSCRRSHLQSSFASSLHPSPPSTSTIPLSSDHSTAMSYDSQSSASRPLFRVQSSPHPVHVHGDEHPAHRGDIAAHRGDITAHRGNFSANHGNLPVHSDDFSVHHDGHFPAYSHPHDSIPSSTIGNSNGNSLDRSSQCLSDYLAAPSPSPFAFITVLEKQKVLSYVLRENISVASLRNYASLHYGLSYRCGKRSLRKAEFLDTFKCHTCSPFCLVSMSDAANAGVENLVAMSNDDVSIIRRAILAGPDVLSNVPPVDTQSPSGFMDVDVNEASHYTEYALLDNKEKGSVLSTMLANPLTVIQLRRLSQLHFGLNTRGDSGRLNKEDLISNLKEHHCSHLCLVHLDDANYANVRPSLDVMPTEVFQKIMAEISSIRSKSSASSPRKRKALSLELQSMHDMETHLDASKRRRLSTANTVSSLLGDLHGLADSWPQRVPLQTRKQLIAEFRDFTNALSLGRTACSFCGTNELSKLVKMFKTDALNIDLLVDAVVYLREKCDQPAIEVFDAPSTQDGFFKVCHSCRSCVKGNKFVRIPLYSYANCCWIGDVPEELRDLTFLE